MRRKAKCFRRGSYVDRILKGEKPAGLAAEWPKQN
jgi:hypothetical protein